MNDPENPETFTYPPLGPSPEAAAARFVEQLDQENLYAPSMNPVPVPEEQPVDWLIDRVIKVVPETAQMGTEPLTTKAGVLAQLYQAQALRGIEGLLFGIDQKLERALGLPRVTVEKPEKTVSDPDSDRSSIGRLLVDQIEEQIQDLLDPELSREEVIVKLKNLQIVIENADWPWP